MKNIIKLLNDKQLTLLVAKLNGTYRNKERVVFGGAKRNKEKLRLNAEIEMCDRGMIDFATRKHDKQQTEMEKI